MNRLRWVLIAALAMMLGACASQDIPDPEPEAGTEVGTDDDWEDGFGDEGLGEGEEFGWDEGADGEGELVMVIYFDFDQSEIRPEDQATLERHANQLANSATTQVRLEGHADERGSREYNIGLGERRAQAVRRLLLIQGASADQVMTVSFGEERPAAFGSDEESYGLNRRVEFKYIN